MSSQSPEWIRQARIKIVRSSDWQYVQPASEQDLSRFEAESGMSFPDNYRELAGSVGPGSLANFFVFLTPYAELADLDLVAFNLQQQQKWKQANAQAGRCRHLPQLQRMVCFCTNYMQQMFAWDPQDVTDADAHEYGIYFVSSRLERKPERVAGTFDEFIQEYCLGGGYEKTFQLDQFPERGSKLRYLPRQLRFKRSRIAESNAREDRKVRQRIEKGVEAFTAPDADRLRVAKKYGWPVSGNQGKMLELKLSDFNLQEADCIALLKAVASEPLLESLSLQVGVTDKTLSLLRPLKPLRILEIGPLNSDFRQKLSGAGLKSLKGLHQLERLTLQGLEIDDGGLRYLPKFRAIQFLSLSTMNVRDEILPHLVDCCPTLETLSFFETKIDGSGFPCLSTLKHLKEILAGCSQVTNQGLASLPVLETVTALNLNFTKITNAGLSFLERLPNLENLDLSYTKVTDSGISRLQRLSRLKTLSLEGTKVTDAGLPHLAKIPMLKAVNCYQSGVSIEAARKFRKVPQHCWIEVRNP